MPRHLVSMLMFCLAGGMAISEGSASSALNLTDIEGKNHQFFAQTDASIKGVVFLFTLHDCPVSNAYAPELNRLHREFSSKGFQFYLVYVDSELSNPQAQQHLREYHYEFQALMDSRHVVVKKSGATIAPSAAVFSNQGDLLYLGRIDDRYVTYGKRRNSPKNRDLHDALENILEGKPCEKPDKPPVGCFIPERK